MNDQYVSANCSVCKHESRADIENAILAGLTTAKSIALQYGISESSLSNHRNKHMSNYLKDRLRDLAYEKIAKGETKDCTLNELIGALKYIDEQDQKTWGDCSQCVHKQNSVTYALKDFLGNENTKVKIKIKEFPPGMYTAEEEEEMRAMIEESNHEN